MFDNIENLKLTFSSQGISKSHKTTRKTHAFIFRTSGTGIFNIGDKNIVTNEGDMLFIPQGSFYEYSPVQGTECQYTAINFYASLKDPKLMLYSLENFSEAKYIATHFTSLWNLGNQSEKYKALSLFYSLLSYISNIENVDYSFKRKFELIEPAVTYLKTNIYDCSLKADKLHLLCGISDTYFRKIFMSKFGTGPQEYIISKRISQAKSTIDSGNFSTIGELAHSVGYSDPLYFSRAFKKKYGLSPLNMSKEV